MLNRGEVRSSDLAWYPGLKQWTSVSEIHLDEPGPEPIPVDETIMPAEARPKKTRLEKLGRASMIIGVSGFPIWLITLCLALWGLRSGQSSGSPFMVILGFLILALIGINLVAFFMGVISCFHKGMKKAGVVGLVLNALQILIIGSIFGIGARSASTAETSPTEHEVTPLRSI